MEKRGRRIQLALPGNHLSSGNRTELEIFKVDPGRYAPQLLGCDPVILNKQDRAIPGDTKYGAYYDHNLYLFVDLESREEFKKNPDRFSRTMHVLKMEQVESAVLTIIYATIFTSYSQAF